MDTYRVIVIDDDDALRDTFVTLLRRRSFEAEGFDEAERFLTEALDTASTHQKQPDLVIVDLQLKTNRMKGMDLIRELVTRDVPTEILAVTGNLPDADLLEAAITGASDWVPKPYDFLTLMPTLANLARTGRKRRMHRALHSAEFDVTRLNRPVFLSYSDEDRAIASVIKRYLETRDIQVWYAPSTLRVGDPWQERISEGLKNAKIFVAIVSNSYFTRAYCIDELIEFDERARKGPEPRPLFIPLISELSEETQQNPMYRNIRNWYQCRDISGRKIMDGLTDLLLRIEDRLDANRPYENRATA